MEGGKIWKRWKEDRVGIFNGKDGRRTELVSLKEKKEEDRVGIFKGKDGRMTKLLS
jgi:hypothetical protein